MLDQAIAHYESGDRAAAKAAAASIAEASPERGDALNLLAVIAQDEGQQSEAERYARAAIALNAHNPIYLNTLGNGLLSQGRSDEAVSVSMCIRDSTLAPGGVPSSVRSGSAVNRPSLSRTTDRSG